MTKDSVSNSNGLLFGDRSFKDLSGENLETNFKETDWAAFAKEHPRFINLNVTKHIATNISTAKLNYVFTDLTDGTQDQNEVAKAISNLIPIVEVEVDYMLSYKSKIKQHYGIAVVQEDSFGIEFSTKCEVGTLVYYEAAFSAFTIKYVANIKQGLDVLWDYLAGCKTNPAWIFPKTIDSLKDVENILLEQTGLAK